MGLFKKKPISERINKKWTPKTCPLSTLEAILLEDDLIDIWVRYYDTYFRICASLDFDNEFKWYYISLNMDWSLSKLLNNTAPDAGTFSSKNVKEVFDVALVDGKPLADIWHNCVIVAMDEMSPDNDRRL